MPVKSIEVPRLEARVRLYSETHGRAELLGFADLVIAEAFVIKGIRIVSAKEEDGARGEPFISFPSRKGSKDEKYFDVAHPITPQAHLKAKEVILEAYRQAAATAEA